MVEYDVQHNLNDFLYVIQNYDRSKWHPYVTNSK